MEGSGSTLRITVLGSGTSVGVPTIGCDCGVCRSTDPRDKRLRPSVWIEHGGYSIVVDTTPDFRYQALRAGLRRVDAILFTHSHADHILGLDDVRPFNFHQRGPIPIYGSPDTIRVIQHVFRYVFDEKPSQSSVPRIKAFTLDEEPFELCGLKFLPVPLLHGDGNVLGFRFGAAAYLTDHSEVPESSLELLNGLDVLFLDALRHQPHPTHSTVEQSLKVVERLKPKRAFFTHICHDLPHEQTEQNLPPYVRLAFDGLRIEVEGLRAA